MSPAEIREQVLRVLREVQSLSGNDWRPLRGTDRPIGDLDCFDSLVGIEATALIETGLGWGDLGVDSLFVSDSGSRALTVDQIVERIVELHERSAP